MSVKAFFKFLLALAAAVFLPLSFTQHTDHYSGAWRNRWEWAGLPLTKWQSGENPEFCWVRDVLKLPPDYFLQSAGPSIFAYSIGALPGKFMETRLYKELWEQVSAEEKPLVCAAAVLCLLENDYRARELLMDEALKRWRRA